MRIYRAERSWRGIDTQMMVAFQGSVNGVSPSSLAPAVNCRPPSDSNLPNTPRFSRRTTLILTPSLSSLFLPQTLLPSAAAREFDEDEEVRVVRLFQETSPSVVFIQVLKLPNDSNMSKAIFLTDESDAKVEGTGSGFIWDKYGHIVTNYHVIANLPINKSGLQFCKVILVDAQGNKFSAEGKIVGFDPSYDLAVLKVESEGRELKPAVLGSSNTLRVGQTCYAIGNPYGYENTLTTGVRLFGSSGPPLCFHSYQIQVPDYSDLSRQGAPRPGGPMATTRKARAP